MNAMMEIMRLFLERARKNPYYLFVQAVGTTILILWGFNLIEWRWVPISLITAAVGYSLWEFFLDKKLASTPEHIFGALTNNLKDSSIYLENLLMDKFVNPDSEKRFEFNALRDALKGLEIPTMEWKMGSAPHARVWASYLRLLHTCAKKRDLNGGKEAYIQFEKGNIDTEAVKEVKLYKPTEGDNGD